LGSLNRREIVALVGVAPFCRDSGTRSGTKRIKGGRANVRVALYMATFAVIRWNKTFKDFYQRLIVKGKNSGIPLAVKFCKFSSCPILGNFVEFRPDTWSPVTALRSVPGCH